LRRRRLRAALVGIERKKQEQMQISAWRAARARRVPEEFRPLREQLLYKPDRNRAETKALDERAQRPACHRRAVERCGALPQATIYHLNRFSTNIFPKGTDFSSEVRDSRASGFASRRSGSISLDDAATTEIDDAFSWPFLRPAAYASHSHCLLRPGFAPGSALRTPWARERLSTVYMPGPQKITMLPPEAIERFSLTKAAERLRVPSISMWRSDDFVVESHHNPRRAWCALWRTCAIRQSKNLMRVSFPPTLREDIPYSR